jgi:two-component sensor histidine kinase
VSQSRAPSPPWNEADRLAALQGYGILDSPPEPDFDDITRVAALVCKAPIALVSLVADTRQWFKSEIGLGVRETPLSMSICAHAILQPGLFVVPDTAEDPRFSGNPLVTGEPRLRFYAGARLDSPEGLPLGTVCVLDRDPRPEGLTTEQAETLLALARQAVTHIELRRTIEARDLLSRELSHRIKNIFTVVGALATLAARANPEAQTFAAEFRRRIHALSQATEYVLPRGGALAHSPDQSVQGLLRLLLSPYRSDGEERLFVEGDDALLGPNAAVALALVVHENATNAVKYGALASPRGRVTIRCSRRDDALDLIWEERGGAPAPDAPDKVGFGTAMATRSVSGQLGGTIDYVWSGEGLTIRVSAPLASLAR